MRRRPLSASWSHVRGDVMSEASASAIARLSLGSTSSPLRSVAMMSTGPGQAGHAAVSAKPVYDSQAKERPSKTAWMLECLRRVASQ